MAGVRVGVTSGRRGEELVGSLTRLGARVLWAPTVEILPVPTAALKRQTAVALAVDPVWVVVTTAEGLERWVEGTGTARADVLRLLAAVKVAARGAKAAAASRRYGVAAVLTSPTERGADLAGLVAGQAEAGDPVVVVVAGNASPEVVTELRATDLQVHIVAPYRWRVPAANGPGPGRSLPAGELVRALAAGEIDAMVFTSPPAVDGLFKVAASLGLEAAAHAAMAGTGAGRVLVAAIGPATAEALEERRVAVGVCPLHPRIPALANALATAPIGFRSFGRPEPLVIDPRTRSVTGPGGAVALSDLQFALLASLARRPGMTCPTSVLLREVWGEIGATGPARRRLEVLASRLRARLVPIEVHLATVPKRGYRLELCRRPMTNSSLAQAPESWP